MTILCFPKVDEHKNNLLNYIIFLRITPFLPNWFINITSPVIGVPLSPFFFGTFLGKELTSAIFFYEEFKMTTIHVYIYFYQKVLRLHLSSQFKLEQHLTN